MTSPAAWLAFYTTGSLDFDLSWEGVVAAGGPKVVQLGRSLTMLFPLSRSDIEPSLTESCSKQRVYYCCFYHAVSLSSNTARLIHNHNPGFQRIIRRVGWCAPGPQSLSFGPLVQCVQSTRIFRCRETVLGLDRGEVLYSLQEGREGHRTTHNT